MRTGSMSRKGKGGQVPRWVVKTDKSPKKDKRARDSAEPEMSLEDFRSAWQPLPDENSHSSKDYYFASYAHFGIHEDMLKDEVRTGSYMRSIMNSRHLFEGKTVLDVGSGTGILCLFAAKAGAKQCIGIECSDIVNFARTIAEQNGFGDVITYVHGKVEEVKLPVEQVDIIISEWMGYFLIYESMLDSVLYARDRWLVKNGLIFPDHARLHVAAIEDADYKDEKIGFWGQLWGLDFSPLQPVVMQEPISDIVEQSGIATNVACVLEIDLHKCRREDLDFFAAYELRATRKDFLHALVFWFDVSFRACSPPVVMSTAPGKKYTHWKQTVLYFKDALVANQGDVLSGMLAVRKSEQNPRDIDIKLSYQLDGQYPHPSTVQCFRLR
mmetsp:Transcript_96446/g.176912  ORF Transcript_96446/g.176912 Transcript_96446/m.176912 type:complete len:383 (-) Transcript_96446:5-1153(-)